MEKPGGMEEKNKEDPGLLQRVTKCQGLEKENVHVENTDNK